MSSRKSWWDAVDGRTFGSKRLLLLLLSVFFTASGCGAQSLKSTQGSSSTPVQGSVLWTADQESGDFSSWYLPGTAQSSPNAGGGVFLSGQANCVVENELPHTGNWGIRLTIATPSNPTSGARLFRWHESHLYPGLFYSIWLFFPQRFTIDNFWNIMQWKSRPAGQQDSDPFFFLNARNTPSGDMEFNLYNWQTKQNYYQNLATIPVGKWMNIQAFYLCSGDATGRVIVWQDGVQLFDVTSVNTRYASGDCGWSVNNYSDGLQPSPATIYADDAEIRIAQ